MAGLEPLQLIEIEKTPSVVERINKTLADTGKILKEEEVTRKGIAKGMAAELVQVEAGHQARVKQFESSQNLVNVERKKMDVIRQAASEASVLHDQVEEAKRLANEKTNQEELFQNAKLLLAKDKAHQDELDRIDEIKVKRQELFELSKQAWMETTQASLTNYEQERNKISEVYKHRRDTMKNALASGVKNEVAVSAKIVEINEQQSEALLLLKLQTIATELTALSDMAAAVADQGQSFFEFAKATAIAEATMSTWNAANRAMTNLPPPWSYAMAAATITLGLARVAKISGQKAPTFKKEMGGPVSSGKPYLVGERGPEMFVPKSAGDIQPSVGPTNVTVNINAVDTVGFDELLFARRAVLIRIINQALNRQGRQGLI
jgi:hypothetical protein